jgi:hypothetical protein
LPIEIDQALRRGGQKGGDKEDGIAVQVEPGSVARVA